LLTKEQLLIEIEDIIRTAPSPVLGGDLNVIAWFGRASNALVRWDPTVQISTGLEFAEYTRAKGPLEVVSPFDRFMGLLHQARHDLRLETTGPLNVAIAHRMPFEYFDEIRKIIELAKRDLLFVDPYLDAEFVSRYLGLVATGVTIRLLAREKLKTLLPAVDVFARQNGANIQIRSAPDFHDRFLLVDGVSCYQSGASFKDGAKTSPTTLTQITDAFEATKRTYEDIWSRATVAR
jgi:hypothetical protein